MRLVFLTTRTQPDRGLFQTMTRLARLWQVRHEVEIWLASASGGTDWWGDLTVRELVPRDASPSQEPSRLVPRDWEPRFSAAGDLALSEALRDAPADLVVTTSPGTLAAAAAWLPDGTPVVHHERGRSGAQAATVEALRSLGHRVSAVLVPHRAVGERLAAAVGAVQPPTFVLPDPLGAAVPPRATGASRVVVAAASFRPNAQIDGLIRAFALAGDDLSGWRLRVFGDGPHRESIVAMARKHALFDRFEAPGRVADMAPEWARAGLAVSTSAGVLPLPVAEAMAAGVPVVAQHHPAGAGELLTHQVHGLLVSPRSAHAMADALSTLAADEPRRRQLGAAGVEAVADRAPALVGARWEEILTAVVRGTEPGGVPPRQPGSPQAEPAPAEERTELLPHTARQHVLRSVLELTRGVTDRWMVLRGVGGAAHRVVLPAADRLAWAEAASAAPAELHLLDDDDPSRSRARLSASSADLARRQPPVLSVSLGPVVDGRPALDAAYAVVDVEFWEPGRTGLVPPRANEWVTRWRPDDEVAEAELDGVGVRALGWTTQPTVAEVLGPIDAVYTWVDGADPEWASRRDARLAGSAGLATNRSASGRARFTNRDELRYSLRSVHMFAPWIRRIYLVTDRQAPAWLAPDDPTVTVVDHRDLLPAELLPTFNSHAIESALHLIDGLAERFVYFNDDVMLGRPTGPERFFQASGRFAAFVSDQALGEDDREAAAFKVAGVNNRRLLQRECGRTITRVLRHAPHPFTRTAFADTVARFPEEVSATRAAPFRSESDVSVASSLVQHHALLTGLAYESHELDVAYVGLTDPLVSVAFADVLSRRDSDVVCVADHHDWAVPEAVVDQELRRFLEAYFPIAAPWERSAASQPR